MKTGILWDLDGTLLDTLEDLLDATNYALGVHGFPPRTLAELRTFVGNGAVQQLRLAMGPGNEEHLDGMLATYKPWYTAHCQIKTRPYRGILEALAELGKEYPMAIVSNKPDAAVKELCARHFPGIYALGEKPDCPRKPAPNMVYRAMADMGVEKCVYVGDSEVDIRTAENAGVACLSVTWGFRDREDLEKAGGTHFCENPEELPTILKKIIG